MKFVVVFTIIVTLVLSDLTCPPDKVYAKVTKQCKKYAHEESYEIYLGPNRLEVGTNFANDEKRVTEYCLKAAPSNLYLIKLKDSWHDSWTSGSWLMIQGLYGNVVFKNYLSEKDEESFIFSLNYGILKGEEWKFISNQGTIASEWISKTFADSEWTSVNLASSSVVSTGTQYFRKSFSGKPFVAAYELEFQYRYGIIAYINGIEVFRDNMPDGNVTPSTYATGSYSTLTYHGVIRPGYESQDVNSLLAVELHFLESTPQTNITFDAYLGQYASTILKDQCYIYSYDVSVISPAGLGSYRAFNYHKSDYFSLPKEDLPATLTYQLNGPQAYINGLRIWPSTRPYQAPGSFIWQGSKTSSTTSSSSTTRSSLTTSSTTRSSLTTTTTTTTTSWKPIITETGQSYANDEYVTFKGSIYSDLYKYYRLIVSSVTTDENLSLFEIQPMICSHQPSNTLTFTPSNYTYYAKYGNVLIQPNEVDFTNCTVSPSLPEGVTLDAATCTISGVALSAIPKTVFTMTSTISPRVFEGTFELTIAGCEGTLVSIYRNYKSSSYKEAFVIKDAITQNVILDVPANSGQPTNQVVTYILCLTGTKYTVTTDSISDFWQGQSHLFIRAFLDEFDYETLIRVRYDVHLGIPPTHVFNVNYKILSMSTWHYKMGEIPMNWYNANKEGWSEGHINSYPESSNQIQLYKKTFTVDSVNKLAGFVISLRYKYGCIIYLNNHEVFRNGVDGELSTSSMAETVYSDVRYHQISLPIKTMVINNEESIEYIKQGSNTIAIALIAINANQKTSVFDCALRLMTEGSLSRVFDYSITSAGLFGSPQLIANHYHSYVINSNKCTDNYWQLTFDNDRREWISSVTIYLYYTQSDLYPRQFVLKARNSNTEAWTVLKTVTDMTWSLAGQRTKFWLENNKPYNQYYFENFATGDDKNCRWKLCTIDLASDSTAVTIPDLAYPSPIEIYKDIEMGEVYPTSVYYYDFTIEPALPEGIALDSYTGTISGTATAILASTSHTITAKKYGGGSSTCTIEFAVTTCTTTKGLVTLVVNTDTKPTDAGYKVYQGKGTSGQVITSVDHFVAMESLMYGDFCLPYGIYTVEIIDTDEDGWINPAGYYLTIDMGEMVIEGGHMPDATLSITTMISTYIPFQIEYSQWKLSNTGFMPSPDWTHIDYDDSTWEEKKAAEFGNHVGTTAYIRHEVTIPDIADYYVLNIRVKYAGGLVAYFNGRKVARFNLEENYDEASEALGPHDATLFSKFHVILSTVGAVTGKNIMAFEIHRNSVESAVIFDATGVFGVNDCSVVVDSFTMIEGDVSITTPEGLFDLMPQTYGYIPNEVGASIEWSVDNLEGSKYNSFGMLSVFNRSNYGFSVYARWRSEDDYVSAIAVINQQVGDRRRETWSMDVGLAGFREFKFEVDAVSNYDVYLSSYIMEYCKASGTNVCEGIDDYPAVGEGQISPNSCPKGFRGYSYRECKDGQLGDIQYDKCMHKLPDKLHYEKEHYVFVKDTVVTTGNPSYMNIISTFYLQNNTSLPDGLFINTTTGEISGIPTILLDSEEFTIRGSNPSGETITTVTLSIRKGACPPEGVYEYTFVDEEFVYDCSIQGNYVGTQKRICILGETDGVWLEPTGMCISVINIIFGIVVVVVLIAVLCYLVIKTHKQKAVKGTKGKVLKSSKQEKTMKV